MNKKILQIIERLQHIGDSDKYTVFYNFSGHINCFKFSIYKGEWDIGKEPILKNEYKIRDGHFLSIDNYSVIIDFENIMNDLNSFDELN